MSLLSFSLFSRLLISLRIILITCYLLSYFGNRLKFSLQLSPSLQFQVYFVCWRILKNVCWTYTSVILISSDANYTSLKITLARLHWTCQGFFFFFFLGNLAGASSFSYFWKQGHTTTPEEAFPPFWEKCEDSVRSLLISTEKMQEIGPAVYRPVPRRLKRLTVYRCHSKVSSFSPVLSRPWVLVRSETWTLDLNPRPPAWQSGALQPKQAVV